jgi:ubiquitin-protein ligase
VVQDKQGHTVATIKKQTWYVRKRQWHTVRPQLVRREKQAMFRLYPNMEMEIISSGDIIWQGPLTTWTQNNYEVQLRYPASFPFSPPRVFVN